MIKNVLTKLMAGAMGVIAYGFSRFNGVCFKLY